MVVTRQAPEKIASDALERRSTELLQQPHAVEPRTPCLDDLAFGGAGKGKLPVGHLEDTLHGEAGPPEVAGKLPPHTEVVPAVAQGVGGVCLQQPHRLRL